MLLVLTGQHPGYHGPLPGEQFCYGHAHQIFTDARGAVAQTQPPREALKLLADDDVALGFTLEVVDQA